MTPKDMLRTCACCGLYRFCINFGRRWLCTDCAREHLGEQYGWR